MCAPCLRSIEIQPNGVLERDPYVKMNEVFRVEQYGLSSVKNDEFFRVKQFGLSSIKKNEVFRVKQYGLLIVEKNELGDRKKSSL